PDDFYVFSTRKRLELIDAARQQTLADLSLAKSGADYDSASEYVQRLADLDAQQANLVNLHQQYQRSMTAPAPPELTPEEQAAKPWDRMTWDDALDLARESKYGRDLTHNDPHVQAGYREVARRRARGE